MEPAGRLSSQALDVKIELVDEIVARTRAAGRDSPHVAAVEHTASLIVEGESAGSRLHEEIAVSEALQPSRDIVLKVIVGEVEEIGFPVLAGAGACIDGDPEPQPAPFEQDVKVRALAPALRLPIDDSAGKEAVTPDSHPALPGTSDYRRAIDARAAVILPELPKSYVSVGGAS
jgi:hypothetical protein